LADLRFEREENMMTLKPGSFGILVALITAFVLESPVYALPFKVTSIDGIVTSFDISPSFSHPSTTSIQSLDGSSTQFNGMNMGPFETTFFLSHIQRAGVIAFPPPAPVPPEFFYTAFKLNTKMVGKE
jgi:hypothetical protein